MVDPVPQPMQAVIDAANAARLRAEARNWPMPVHTRSAIADERRCIQTALAGVVGGAEAERLMALADELAAGGSAPEGRAQRLEPRARDDGRAGRPGQAQDPDLGRDLTTGRLTMNPGTMAPETIDLGQITADTQLLGDATSRRFLSGLWELEGCALPVMPTVALELPGNVRGAENRRWQRTIRRDLARTNVRYEPGTYNAILRATREAAEAWTKEELERPDGVVAVQGSVETDAAAAALARALPAICFRSTNERERTQRPRDRGRGRRAWLHPAREREPAEHRARAAERLAAGPGQDPGGP